MRTVGADHDPCHPTLVTDPQRRTVAVQIDVGHRHAAPDHRPGILRQPLEGRIECRAVEADGRWAASIGAVGEAHRRPAGRLEAHRRDRVRDVVDTVPVQAGPGEGGDGSRRREHAAGAPVPGHASLEHRDLDAPPSQPGRERRAGRASPDDRDVDRPGHDRVRHDRPFRRAASATRWPPIPSKRRSTRSPATASRAVSSDTV
jgi:hypothetical protein